MSTSLSKRSLFAGIWFALAASIPVAYVFLSFGELKPKIIADSELLTALVPILISGLIGSFLGSSILNPAKMKSGWRASVRGFLISLLTYVLFIFLAAVSSIIPSDDPFNVIVFWGFGFLFGFYFVGWLILLVGTLAGWLLFILRMKIVNSLEP